MRQSRLRYVSVLTIGQAIVNMFSSSYLGGNESIVACPGRETASPQGVILTGTKFLLRRAAPERKRMYLSSLSRPTSVIREYSSLITDYFNVDSLWKFSASYRLQQFVFFCRPQLGIRGTDLDHTVWNQLFTQNITTLTIQVSWLCRKDDWTGIVPACNSPHCFEWAATPMSSM